MLPLVTNVLPQANVPSNTMAGAAPLLVARQGIATDQQITAVAVTAAGATSGYAAQTSGRRSEPNAARASGTSQPGRAAILPDPEFWKVPTREALPQAPAMQVLPQIAVNLPQVAQYAAQVIAQQPLPGSADEPDGPQPPPKRSSEGGQALPGRKPGIGDARGPAAYAIATQRNFTISFAPTVQAVS